MKTIKFFAIAAMAAMTFVACDDKNNGQQEEPLTGPDLIATENLVVYMPFEDINAPMKSGKGLTFNKKVGGAKVEKGFRGNCYAGAADAYLEFDVNGADYFLTGAKSFTVAAWVNTPVGDGASAIINLDGGDTGMGAFDLLVENGWYNEESKGVGMKGYLFNTATEWKGQDLANANEYFAPNNWFHVVYMYDAATSKISLWANGAFICDSERFAGPEVDGAQPKMGDFVAASDVKHFYLGAWMQVARGEETDAWRTNYTGKLDELRIYNKALTEAEVADLYRAEVIEMNE